MDTLTQRIIYKWEADSKKPMLCGRPGCGKTAFVNHIAKTLGVKCRAINLSTFEGIDANGMPYLNGQHELTVSRPFWLEGLQDGDILFLDEFQLALTEVRNAFQTFLISGVLPSGEHAPRLRIIGAMNPASDTEGFADFSNAMKDRWAFIPFDFPTEEWHKLFKDNFGKPQSEREQEIRIKLSKFLTTNPHMLEGRKPLSASAYGVTDESEAMPIECATPNRRNWDNLARELAQTKDDNELRKFQKNMFIENVGLEAWRNYKEFVATETKSLSSYNWDGEPDEITQQVNRLKAEKDTDKQVEYFVRAYNYCKNKEVVASMLPDVLQNAIRKYALDYKTHYPEFYAIYKEIGA